MKADGDQRIAGAERFGRQRLPGEAVGRVEAERLLRARFPHDEVVRAVLQPEERRPRDAERVHAGEGEGARRHALPRGRAGLRGDARRAERHAHALQRAGQPAGQKYAADRVVAQAAFRPEAGERPGAGEPEMLRQRDDAGVVAVKRRKLDQLHASLPPRRAGFSRWTSFRCAP